MNTVSRLVRAFAPEHYTLSIKLMRVKRSFSGLVTIEGETTGVTDEIRVHAKELTIEAVSVDQKETTWHQDENDELVLETPGISKGVHTITIRYSGKITDPMHGLYPCYYEHEGQKKELLATQFESTYAREVFPCIDEPEAKAVFDLTLETETGVTVLSNMPIKTQAQRDDNLITAFESTPRMSSYLLAWVVGELHRKTARTTHGVEVNAWATLAQPSSSLEFALDIATRTIDFLDDYFNVPYPLPKSDHVALPDFSSGAMENWGLITYRESTLLSDKNTSIVDKRYVASVIAHELSHQWFGNLVTMKWWNDLWLNESFANMMEYLIVDHLEPEWNIWLDHASAETVSSLRRDALDGVQAIQADVNHPDEVATLFDPSIVYAKGGRLIKMLWSYVGDDAFRKALSHYFNDHKYQNTEASDLWHALSQASGKDIKHLMQPWITQPGFPVIHASKKGEDVSLTQERFFIGAHSPSRATWPVPLSFQNSLFESKEAVLTGAASTPILNQEGRAHILVHYDETMTTNILKHIASFSPIDRLLFLHDQTLLARSGVISSATLIPLLSHYQHETNHAVWDMLSLAINELKLFVAENESAEEQLKALVAHLAREQFMRLGWDARKEESEEDTILRPTIIGLMLYSEDEAVATEAIHRYDTQQLNDLDPELRASIISAKVKANPAVVDSLIDAYRATSHTGLRDDLAIGVTATKDHATAKKLLKVITNTSIVRPQDFLYWYVRLMRNRHTRDLAWQWTQHHWQWIESTFQGDANYDAFPRYIASSLITRTQLTEYQTFFSPLKTQRMLARNIELGITDLSGKIDLFERDEAEVCRALLKHHK